MRIQVLEGDNVLHDETYAEGLVRVGSHDECTLHLADLRIAPQALTLFHQPDGTWIIESSSMGAEAYLNGHKITAASPVADGDEIELLDYRLKILLDAEPIPLPPSSGPSEDISRIRQYPLPAGAVVLKEDDAIRLGPGERSRLSELAFQLRSCDDIPKLMGLALRMLLETFRGARAWMGARRSDYGRLEFVEGKSAAGNLGGESPLIETVTYRCLERTQFICARVRDSKDMGSFMAVPLIGSRGRVGLLYVDAMPRGTRYGQRHLEHLMMIQSLVAVQLEAVFREQARLQEAIAIGEQSFVRQVQARLDPTSVPNWNGYHLAVYGKAGADRVGDVYDVMKLPNGMMALLMAHATGEPSRVAMAMTEVRAAFRIGGLHADPPHTLLRELNWILHDERSPCAMACVAVIINPKTGVAQYATAGDIGAVVIDARGEIRSLLDPDAAALGSQKAPTYRSKIERMGPTESLVLYSPGCLNVCDGEGIQLGRQGFLDALCDGFGLPATTVLEELATDLAAFFKDGRQPDDITILLLRRMG